MEVTGQLHAPAALLPEKGPTVSNEEQNNRKILPHLGIDPRIHGVLAPSITTVLTKLLHLSLILLILENVRFTEEV
jgi:hypothetical protein